MYKKTLYTHTRTYIKENIIFRSRTKNNFFFFIFALSIRKTIHYVQWVMGRTQKKSCSLTVTVYYSKRIHINISKGKRHIRQSLRKTRTSFQLSLPGGVTQATVLNSSSNNVWWHKWSVCQSGKLRPREAHWASVSRPHIPEFRLLQGCPKVQAYKTGVHPKSHR